MKHLTYYVFLSLILSSCSSTIVLKLKNWEGKKDKSTYKFEVTPQHNTSALKMNFDDNASYILSIDSDTVNIGGVDTPNFVFSDEPPNGRNGEISTVQIAFIDESRFVYKNLNRNTLGGFIEFKPENIPKLYHTFRTMDMDADTIQKYFKRGYYKMTSEKEGELELNVRGKRTEIFKFRVNDKGISLYKIAKEPIENIAGEAFPFILSEKYNIILKVHDKDPKTTRRIPVTQIKREGNFRVYYLSNGEQRTEDLMAKKSIFTW